jgi:hypothetical protein
MAIKVATTTVINDSRELQNITGASGVYDDFHPSSSSITTVLDFNKPVMTRTMGSNITFTEASKAVGRNSILLLDRSAIGYTPTFSANVKFAEGTTPTWSDHRYWQIGFICWDATTVRAAAVGYD